MSSQHELEDWTTEDVARWLDAQKLGHYKELLCEKHRLCGVSLINLTENDLRKPPVSIPVLGDIKRIIAARERLVSSWLDSPRAETKIRPRPSPKIDRQTVVNRRSPRKDSYSDDEDYEYVFTTDYPDTADPTKINPLEDEVKNALVSETFRTAVSLAYAWMVAFLASFMLAVVHDRVPDSASYPPLPDIVLENIPLMPWAFALCEVCAGVLATFWLCIIVFHRHRLVVLRRTCALFGTIFLLRCFTMYVTSLSVPGVHLECSAKTYGTFERRLNRAVEIFLGMGMATQGVRTCGDYMFSGHTATLTLLNFFVTEYTPRRWYYLHTLCWLLNMFGIFFILAGHEHYSIDVLISFYISSRIFLYYHMMASSVSLRTSDQRKRQIYFPLFWFFEYGCPLTVPNEFEWPFTVAKLRHLFTWSNNPRGKKPCGKES